MFLWPSRHDPEPQPTAVVKLTRPSGRILYDAMSVLLSERAQRHFEVLDRLAKRGLIRTPAPTKP